MNLKIRSGFKHIKTERLERFLAQAFENYPPFICPRLDGERRVEVGENGQILEAVGLGGPLKLPALSLSLTFVWGR